ncbi:methyltransferase-like protein 22 isoform X1 [Lampetra fluviatilis]
MNAPRGRALNLEKLNNDEEVSQSKDEDASQASTDSAATTMDTIVFRSDLVLSDIHLFMPSSRRLMVRLNAVGQPVYVSKYKILWDTAHEDGCFPPPTSSICSDDSATIPSKACEEWRSETPSGTSDASGLLDEDGDLLVARKPRDSASIVGERASSTNERPLSHPVLLSQAERWTDEEADEEDDEEGQTASDTLLIEHTMGTCLDDVGKQVWRGAFLLGDYLLQHRREFCGVTALELGAGTGATSIVAATFARTVYCTDVGDDLLDNCQRNVNANKHLYMRPDGEEGGEVKVRTLDWLKNDFCTDSECRFSWTEEEVAHLHDNATVLLAADVCYDDELTDGLFRTVFRIMNNLRSTSSLYIAIEKRYNFTLRALAVTCDAYDHFRTCLAGLAGMEGERRVFTVESVSTDFAQSILYDRVEQLELWKVTATDLSQSSQH